MIYLERGPCPPRLNLSDKDTDAFSELEAARAHLEETGEKPPSTTFKAFTHADVREAVHGTFFKKCVYCEKKVEIKRELNVEHYRPKSKVEDCQSHLGYWWKAMAWDNLLLSCGNCNSLTKQPIVDVGMSEEEIRKALSRTRYRSAGKQCFFPTEDDRWITEETGDLSDEKPLILDPTFVDPEPHIKMVAVGGYMLIAPLGDDVRVKETIRILGLNRADIAEGRMKNALKVKKIIRRIEEVLEQTCETDREEERAQEHLEHLISQLFDYTRCDEEFAGTARFFMRQLMTRLS